MDKVERNPHRSLVNSVQKEEIPEEIRVLSRELSTPEGDIEILVEKLIDEAKGENAYSVVRSMCAALTDERARPWAGKVLKNMPIQNAGLLGPVYAVLEGDQKQASDAAIDIIANTAIDYLKGSPLSRWIIEKSRAGLEGSFRDLHFKILLTISRQNSTIVRQVISDALVTQDFLAREKMTDLLVDIGSRDEQEMSDVLKEMQNALARGVLSREAAEKVILRLGIINSRLVRRAVSRWRFDEGQDEADLVVKRIMDELSPDQRRVMIANRLASGVSAYMSKLSRQFKFSGQVSWKSLSIVVSSEDENIIVRLRDREKIIGERSILLGDKYENLSALTILPIVDQAVFQLYEQAGYLVLMPPRQERLKIAISTSGKRKRRKR